mgnify:CR=1 FL=1
MDNGRSDILASEFQEVLRCIRCGACLNTCPAYRQIGGHGYGSIYPGPIGAVISPLLGGYDEFKELPYACSLCNACNSVCPVRIPLAQLILKHREKMVELGKTPAMERLSIFGFTTANANPTLWKTGVNIGAKLAGKLIKNGKAPIHLVHWVNGQKHEIYHKQMAKVSVNGLIIEREGNKHGFTKSRKFS